MPKPLDQEPKLLPEFPVEIWLMIFEHLSSEDIAHIFVARSSCRLKPPNDMSAIKHMTGEASEKFPIYYNDSFSLNMSKVRNIADEITSLMHEKSSPSSWSIFNLSKKKSPRALINELVNEAMNDFGIAIAAILCQSSCEILFKVAYLFLDNAWDCKADRKMAPSVVIQKIAEAHTGTKQELFLTLCYLEAEKRQDGYLLVYIKGMVSITSNIWPKDKHPVDRQSRLAEQKIKRIKQKVNACLSSGLPILNINVISPENQSILQSVLSNGSIDLVNLILAVPDQEATMQTPSPRPS